MNAPCPGRLWLPLLLVAALAAGCAPPPAEPGSPAPAATIGGPPDLSADLIATTAPGAGKEPAACGRLDPLLRELVALDDPAARAAELGLPLDGGRAQVIITLAGDDSGALSAYGAEVTGRAADLVQAFVPLDQLCALASDPAVLAVRPPELATPQQP